MAGRPRLLPGEAWLRSLPDTALGLRSLDDVEFCGACYGQAPRESSYWPQLGRAHLAHLDPVPPAPRDRSR